jgi:hypothetical protein
MNLTSDMKTFATHFILSLKNKSRIEKTSGGMTQLKIIVELAIGEGLVMSCPILMEYRININLKVRDFQQILKRFIH